MFPIIRHISDVTPFLTEGIRIKERDAYDVIDYTFAGPETFTTSMSLECRGLKFDKSGRLIARPLHKFFNIGEKQSLGEIDFTQPHEVYDKLDGSMIHGCILNKELTFMTRGGISPQAQMAFLRSSQSHKDLANAVSNLNSTAIFEFTSPDNRIVINYETDELTLLAVRENTSGNYYSHKALIELAKFYDCPLAQKHLPVTNPETFVSSARSIVESEGYVIAFNTGHRIKIKGDDYSLKHGALSRVSSEKYTLNLILTNNADDILPLLEEKIARRLKEFIIATTKCLTDLTDRTTRFHNENKHLARKDYAQAAQKLNPVERVLAFSALDNKNIYDTAKNLLLKASSTQTKLEQNRKYFNNLKWSISDLTSLE